MQSAPIPVHSTRRDPALDLLKWLAMACMVLDHLRYVGWSVDAFYVPGRLAFAWFCLAIAANLARRPQAPLRGRYLGWLLFFSLVAEWPYRLFVGAGEPLNVLPTLALGLLVASASQSRQWRPLLVGALALGVAVGARDQLMFGLAGVLLPTACLLALRRSLGWAVLAGVLCLAANEWWVIVPAAQRGNAVALAGVVACLLGPWLGILLLRHGQGLKVPPMRRWAYAIYPVHFLLLLGLRVLIQGSASPL
jgi:hypothetical protein